jgi:hypothetical protein
MLISGRVALGSPNLRALIVHMRAVDNADTEWEDAQVNFGLLPEELEPELTPTARTAALYDRRSVLNPTRSEISEARVISQPDLEGRWNQVCREVILEEFDEADRDLNDVQIHILHLDPAGY